MTNLRADARAVRYAFVAVTDAGYATTVELASYLKRAKHEVIAPKKRQAKATIRQVWNLPAKERPHVIVCCLALGAVVRLIAPLLGSKHGDPVVLCIDEERQFVVVVTGAHHGGNRAAKMLAKILGATPVITTASDAVGIPDLDNVPGLSVDPTFDCRAALMTRLVNGERLNIWLHPDLSADINEVLAYLAPFKPVMVSKPTAPGIAITTRVVERSVSPLNLAEPHTVSHLSAKTPNAGDLTSVEGVLTTEIDLPELSGLAQDDDDRMHSVSLEARHAGKIGSVSEVSGKRAAVPGLSGLAKDKAGQIPIPSDVLVLIPKTLTLGIGTSKDCPAQELKDLVVSTLQGYGLHLLAVRDIATVTEKSKEPAILTLSKHFDWPVHTYHSRELAAIDVPNPSLHAYEAVGCYSVSEAAAMVHSQGTLLVEKTKSVPTVGNPAAMATVAVAERTMTTNGHSTAPTATTNKPESKPTTHGDTHTMSTDTNNQNPATGEQEAATMGKLFLIGAGPGDEALIPPKVYTALKTCDVVIGLDQYLVRLADHFALGAEVRSTALGQELERAQDAIDQARQGKTVALISSGDIGTFAMASPTLELLAGSTDITVQVIPGITSSLTSSAILGAPLGHDHCNISLSNLMTPWEIIQKRINAAAAGDFVTCIYNPRSKGRDWQLGWVKETMLEHRDPSTPVGLVRNASRPDEHVIRTTLGEFNITDVDMYTMVIIGATNTVWLGQYMVTPRGYTDKYQVG